MNNRLYAFKHTHNFLVLAISVLISVSGLFAKEIIVEKTNHLYGDLENPGFFPSYTVDGESILFTKSGYLGLWILDRAELTVKQITSATGAGYQPISLSNGSIVFRQDEYKSGRKFTSLHSYLDQELHQLTDQKRFVGTINIDNDHLIYLVDSNVKVFNNSSELFEEEQDGYTAVFNDKLTLKVLKDGIVTPLAPLGEGQYIWAELSPNADNIVFTMPGEGTFVCDLDGKIMADIGYANTPHWSPDGQYLVFMKDIDNGDQFTSSEIWVSTANGSQSWRVTNTPDRIEMYPQWSSDGRQISYHTLQGELFETQIQITD